MPGRLTRIGAVILLALPLLGAQNCGVKVKETTELPPEQVLPLKTATLEELLAKLDQLAAGVTTINAVTELAPSTGSAYSGVIEQYRDVRAFVLARREAAAEVDGAAETTPAAREVRLIGQAPVVRKNIFDMVADENRFRIFLPTKNQFIVGPTRLRERREKPIENLRPQHLFEALFLEPPQAEARHLLEENEFGGIRYYAVSEVLELVRVPPKYAAKPAGSSEVGGWDRGRDRRAKLALQRKWWFDRRGLELARVQYFDAAGRLVSDIHYADWRNDGAAPYPWEIKLARPYEDYQLKLMVKELTLNEALPPASFELEPPEKVELINVEAEEDAAPDTEPEEEAP